MKLALVTIAALTMSGCAMSARGPSDRVAASASLRASDGSARGRVTATQTGDTLRLTVAAVGLPAGPHGLHIHAVGRCDAPDFTSAGPHWNPDAKAHGRDNPMGAHVGDLPNIDIGSDGRGSVTFDLAGGTAALLEGEGKAMIIHAAADDYRTDPSGNSGDRVACGVFVAG